MMRYWKRMAVFLLCVLLFAACQPVQDPGTESQNTTQKTDKADGNKGSGKAKTFTYAISGDPGNNVNVITNSERYGLTMIKMVYEPLFTTNAKGELDKNLCESVEVSQDGKTVIAKMKPDLKWSDGEPLTSKDVVFTYHAMLDEKNGGAERSRLLFGSKPVEVKALDDHTVEFTTPEVSASVLDKIGGIFIMPEHKYRDVQNFENNDVNMHPVGAGPFILKEYKAGEYLRFEKNPNYFKGTPKLDTVILRIITDSNTAKMALQNGEVDAWIALAQDKTDLEKNPNLEFHAYSEGRVAFIKLNQWNKDLANKDLRKAIFFALNREEIMTAAYADKNIFELGYSFLPFDNKWVNNDIEKYNQDIEKAKSLMASSGVKDPSFKLAYISEDDSAKKMALVIQQELEKIGVKIELTGMDAVAFAKASYTKGNDKFDMWIGGYIMGTDPDSYSVFYSTKTDDMFDVHNDRLDQLFEEGSKELNEQKRREIYNEIQKIVADEAIIYPMGANKRILVTNKRVRGIDKAELVPIYTFNDMSFLDVQ